MSANYLLLYEYVENMTERRGPYREAHLERIKAGQQAGRIGLAGALGDPPSGGALQFTNVSKDQVKAFAAEDPYAKAGLIASVRIEPWTLV